MDRSGESRQSEQDKPLAGHTDRHREGSTTVTDAASRGRRRRPQSQAGAADRGLRDLVGAGPSQLGVEGALRGRDVNRPSDEDLAAAERDVVLVRRHWTPPATD